MPALVHTTALAVAYLTLFVFAAALVIGLAWLAVATIRRHLSRATERIEQIQAEARTAAAEGNDLRHIDLSRVDLDAELLQLIEGGDSK